MFFCCYVLQSLLWENIYMYIRFSTITRTATNDFAYNYILYVMAPNKS